MSAWVRCAYYRLVWLHLPLCVFITEAEQWECVGSESICGNVFVAMVFWMAVAYTIFVSSNGFLNMREMENERQRESAMERSVSRIRCVCSAALKIRCTLAQAWVESWYYCLRFAHNKFKMTLSRNILFMGPLRHCRIECSVCVLPSFVPSIHLDACKLCKLQWSTQPR